MTRFSNLLLAADNETRTLLADSRDLYWEIDLDVAIQDLLDFDNNTLYPYLESLINDLENFAISSPIAY